MQYNIQKGTDILINNAIQIHCRAAVIGGQHDEISGKLFFASIVEDCSDTVNAVFSSVWIIYSKHSESVTSLCIFRQALKHNQHSPTMSISWNLQSSDWSISYDSKAYFEDGSKRNDQRCFSHLATHSNTMSANVKIQFSHLQTDKWQLRTEGLNLIEILSSGAGHDTDNAKYSKLCGTNIRQPRWVTIQLLQHWQESHLCAAEKVRWVSLGALLYSLMYSPTELEVFVVCFIHSWSYWIRC